MRPWLPPFIAPLTFLPACCPVLSFLSYVVRALPARTRPRRRSHANDVNPQQLRHVHKPPAHKATKRSRSRDCPFGSCLGARSAEEPPAKCLQLPRVRLTRSAPPSSIRPAYIDAEPVANVPEIGELHVSRRQTRRSCAGAWRGRSVGVRVLDGSPVMARLIRWRGFPGRLPGGVRIRPRAGDHPNRAAGSP